VASAEAKLAALNLKYDQMFLAHEAKLEALYEAKLKAAEATRHSRHSPVHNDGTVVTAQPPTGLPTTRRRLATGDKHIAVPSHLLHEFPDGHTCPNLGAGVMKKLLPHTGSDVSYKPSPEWTASTDNELSLTAVNSDWSTSEIQRMPFPMKVVHEGNCTATPKLELQLSTTVLGSLVVDRFDVGAALAQLGASKPYSRLLGSTACGTYDGTYQVTWHLGNTGASCSSACSAAGKTCDNTMLNDAWMKAEVDAGRYTCHLAVATSLAVGSDSEWTCASQIVNNPTWAPFIDTRATACCSGGASYSVEKRCTFANTAGASQDCGQANAYARRFCPCKPS